MPKYEEFWNPGVSNLACYLLYTRGKLEEDYSGISSSQGRNPLNHRRDIDWGSPRRQCQQEEGSSGRNLEMDRETMHPTVNQEPQSRAYSSESFLQHEPNRSRSRSPPSRHFNRTGEEYQELELAHKIKMLEELEWERAGTTRYDISGLPSRATEDVKCGPVRTDEGPPMPKKSILKKQGEPVMDPAIGIESSDDSRQPPVSTQTKRFLSALNRCLGSGLFSSRLREAREETQRQISDGSVHCEHRSKDSTEAENPEESICEFLLPHERISQDDTGFSRILGIMGDDSPIQREKQWHSPDIDDEEKFLYGEDKEEKSVGQESTHQPQSKVVAQPEIGHCLVGRSEIAHHRISQSGVDHLLCRKPAVGTQQRTTGIGGQRSKIAPSRHQEIQLRNLNRPQEIKPGTGPPQKRQPDSVVSQQRQPVVDHNPPKPSEKDQDAPTVDEPQDPQEFERIQNLLKTIGLDIGEAEFSKMAARTQERLYGKKPAAGSSRRSERERELRGVARRSWETHDSPTKSPVSDYNRSISPSPTRRPSHEYSSKEEGKKLKQIQRLGENKHTPTPHSEFQLQQAGYGNNMGTSTSQEPHSSTSIHQSNLQVIETVSLNENRVQQKSSNSMNLKVFGEAERLTQEEEARLKKKENIIMELERLQKLQVAMIILYTTSSRLLACFHACRATEDVKCGPVRTDEGPPMPKKSILKKQGEPVMDPAIGIESSDDSRQPPVSTQTKRFLSALNRCLGSGLFSSRLREAREETQRQISDGSVHCEHRSKDSTEAENPEESICEFLLPHERISQDDTGFSRILGIMGDDSPIQREKQWHSPDIDDEEKFLYGEDKEEKSVGQESTHQPQSKVVAQPEIGHCLVGRSEIAHHRISQSGVDHLLCRKPAVGTQQRTTGIGGQRSKIAPGRHQEIQLRNLNRPQEIKPGTGPPQKRQPDSVVSQQRQPVVDHNPPKPSEKDQDAPTVDEPQDPQEFERIQNLLKTIGLDIGEAEFSKMAARTQERLYGKKPAAGSSRRSERERELRGVARRSWETHDSPTKSPVSDYNRSISPSPTRRPSHEYSSKEEGKKLKQIQRLGENKHTPTPHSEFQLQQAGYGNNMGTSTSQEPHSSTSIHQSNLQVIETVSLNENRVQQKSSNSMNLKVFGEAERLTQEEEARLKKKENIIMELERLQKLQGTVHFQIHLENQVKAIHVNS
ncbi:UNVERIFIED_CONTAM: hypothetical protein FKN15_049539 [Acipenser sinensis]